MIHWFSPLPPAQSDIAHYTGRILPALARRSELTLWTEQATWERELERFAPVRRYRGKFPEREFEPASVRIFNIGNDRKFHATIYRLACAQPGVVVLHDLSIPDLTRKNFPRSRISHRSDCHRLIQRALAVMVHTSSAGESLRRQGAMHVVVHPLPYPAHHWPRPREQQRDETKRLIIFGFLGVNRRLQVVLQALQTYPRKETFRLDIYGKISKRSALERSIQLLGLRNIVTVHGFVPERELDAALERANLAINLRFPTMGEASGSQLRIWDHALPSIVTWAGAYADLATGTVGYVTLANEIGDLHHHFDALRADPLSYAKMGERGREELLGHHTPESYANAIVALSEKAMHPNSP